MKANILITLLFASFFLASCSTANKEKHKELQKLVREGKFDKGLELVNSKDFYADKESRLLKLLELGVMHYYNANFYQALRTFDEAKELSDKLFTVSISKKVTAAVSNDSMDNYYGEKYERSLIRFYQVLAHFALSESAKYESYKFQELGQDGKPVEKVVPEKMLEDKDRRFHLIAARSVLLEWNSLLDSYKATTGGKASYKDDLMAKMFGAFIHERLGSSNDMQIAKNLYLEAKKILLRNFSIYRTYNHKSKEFIAEYNKLHLMNENDVRAKFLKQSHYYQSLEKYIDERLATFNGAGKHNVFFLVSHGFINPKEVKKFDFPLPVDSIPAGVTDKGGFVGFAGKVLKAGKDGLPKIYFELPVISYQESNKAVFTVVKDATGAVVSRKETALVNPMSEIAFQTLDEQSISNMAKVGGRVVTKHLAALGAAYLIFESQKAKSELMAMVLASASYTAANKGIEMSERADLRFWATLPSDYRLMSLNLKPGKYTVEIVSDSQGKEVVMTTQNFEVKNGVTKMLPLIAL